MTDPRSSGTLAYYDRAAAAFRRGTADHDVSQNVTALLEAVGGAPPRALLDLGCGPGRDLETLRALGHDVVGLDGSAAFVEMARAGGFEVLHQDLLALDIGCGRFDGVFANASLFHVPSDHITRVLGEIAVALRPRGVLFSSNPRGDDSEGWSGGRYGCFWTLATWTRLVEGAGFERTRYFYRPEGKPLAEQPWLATVWRKREAQMPSGC